MMPPPVDWPVLVFQSTWPLSAPNAYSSPDMSAAKTIPPAVGVTPASTGCGAWNCQRTVPLSASNEVSQPRASLAGANGFAFSLPSHVVPAGGMVVVSRLSCTVAHQSTAPTYSEFVFGL